MSTKWWKVPIIKFCHNKHKHIIYCNLGNARVKENRVIYKSHVFLKENKYSKGK